MVANLNRVQILIEQLRRQSIAWPRFIVEKQVYEYQDHSVKVVAILKLVRATQSLKAITVLAQSGLFIDFGSIVRCLNDSTDEVYFLLENYPNEPSRNVQKFVKRFFEHSIDGFQNSETAAVPQDKIRSAVVRYIKQTQDHATQKLLERLYDAFCGYVHTNYAHVMEVYNGFTDSYNLDGVLSREEIAKRMLYVAPLTEQILMCAAFAAEKFGLNQTRTEIMEALR